MTREKQTKACAVIATSFLLICSLWLIVSAARLHQHAEYNVFLPQMLGQFYAYQAFMIFGVPGFLLGIFGILICCCCYESCLSCYAFFYVGFVVTGLFCLWPILSDWENLNKAMAGDISLLVKEKSWVVAAGNAYKEYTNDRH